MPFPPEVIEQWKWFYTQLRPVLRGIGWLARRAWGWVAVLFIAAGLWALGALMLNLDSPFPSPSDIASVGIIWWSGGALFTAKVIHLAWTTDELKSKIDRISVTVIILLIVLGFSHVGEEYLIAKIPILPLETTYAHISPPPEEPSPSSPKPNHAPLPAEPKPEIAADFIQGTSPGLLLINKSAAVIKDPVCSYGMWNLSKNPPLMIPTWEVRESGAFIKQNSGRILATADTPQAKPYIAIGDRIFAQLIIDCPECKSSRIYYLYFVYGEPSNSWFSEVPAGVGSNVLLVNNLMEQSGWDPDKFLSMVPHSPVHKLESPTGLLHLQ